MGGRTDTPPEGTGAQVGAGGAREEEEVALSYGALLARCPHWVGKSNPCDPTCNGNDLKRLSKGSLTCLTDSYCERCGEIVSTHVWVDLDVNGYIFWCSNAEKK